MKCAWSVLFEWITETIMNINMLVWRWRRKRANQRTACIYTERKRTDDGGRGREKVALFSYTWADINKSYFLCIATCRCLCIYVHVFNISTVFYTKHVQTLPGHSTSIKLFMWASVLNAFFCSHLYSVYIS